MASRSDLSTTSGRCCRKEDDTHEPLCIPSDSNLRDNPRLHTRNDCTVGARLSNDTCLVDGADIELGVLFDVTGG